MFQVLNKDLKIIGEDEQTKTKVFLTPNNVLGVYFEALDLTVQGERRLKKETLETLLDSDLSFSALWRHTYRALQGRGLNEIYQSINVNDDIETLKSTHEKIKITLKAFADKEFIIIRGVEVEQYGVMYAKNNLCAFSRKSNEKQSKAKVEDSLNGVVAEAVFLAPDSSGFYEEAILSCVSYAYNEQLDIKVYGLTRSDVETATRSLTVARELVDICRLYNINCDISGDIRTQYGEIFTLLVGLMGETKAVQNGHTQYYKKHATYKKALTTKDFSKLKQNQLKDLLALIRYNGSHERTISFIDALKQKQERNKA